MSLVTDIVGTYRGPRRVVRRILAAGVREDRALVILMAGCAVMFVAQWPKLAREAHLTGAELNPMLGGALLAWLFLFRSMRGFQLQVGGLAPAAARYAGFSSRSAR